MAIVFTKWSESLSFLICIYIKLFESLYGTSLKFARGCVGFFVVVNILSHLPDLHDIVFGNGANYPGFVRIPGEIADFCCVSAVNKLERERKLKLNRKFRRNFGDLEREGRIYQEFRRSVFGVFGRLFLADFTEIPDVKTPVRATASEYCFVVRRPLYLENLVFVRLEWMKLELEISEIPKRYGLVGASGGENELRVGIEAQTINLSRVGVDGVTRFACVVTSVQLNEPTIYRYHFTRQFDWIR